MKLRIWVMKSADLFFACRPGWFFAFLAAGIFLVCPADARQNGKDARWESAGKQGIATAFSLESKVWLTLQGGSITEVFYPTADQAQAQWLQFVVFDPETRLIETERENAKSRIFTDSSFSLSFTQENTAANWKISKSYTIDPRRNAILAKVRFSPRKEGLKLYLAYNPSLKNSGLKDTGWSDSGALVAEEGDVFSAIMVSGGFAEMHSGFFGENDGFSILKQDGKLESGATKTEDGNILQMARVSSQASFTFSLGYGKSLAEALSASGDALKDGFAKVDALYRKGWEDYAKALPAVGAKYQKQFNFAAMVLRASEDKSYRGGNVASLSKPWIPVPDANGPYVGGYHLVWARDLYQVATAYIAIGDKRSAGRALDYLFGKQMRPDGSYPQISWLDGRPLGDAVQMDEVSYPLILAYQLGRDDRETYLKNIKPTADYIAKLGPKTQQERWEEKGGYSPSTIAAEIAGLICAADIALKNGDGVSSEKWQRKADEWRDSLEKWTATTKGKYGDGRYYLRLTQNGRPDAGEKMELNNNGGIAEESEILDAGFLELVRLGIRHPENDLLVKSLKVVDQGLKVNTPNGEGWFRYTRDGYGEMEDGRPWNFDRKYTGKGHLWPLLTGERGEYEIALCRALGPAKRKPCLAKASKRLDAMLGFANEGFMIPEQVWEKPDGAFEFGEGACSATPLAWSMAQFIRLAMNLKNGRNLETPEAVAQRYGNLLK